MLLAEELKNVISKIFEEGHQGEGDVEKSKIAVPEGSFEGFVEKAMAKNVSAKIVMLCICEAMIQKVDENDQSIMQRPLGVGCW